MIDSSIWAVPSIGIEGPTLAGSTTSGQNYSTALERAAISATLSASGGAINSNHSFELISDSTGGAFAIDPSTGAITVADSSGQVLSAAGQGMTAAAGDARSQVEMDYQNRLAANAQKILKVVQEASKAFGTAIAIASLGPTIIRQASSAP